MRTHYRLVLSAGVVLLAGCQRSAPPARAVGGAALATVVATIFPLADVTRQLGGDAVKVETLLPSGANPHTFELTPAQAKVLAQAKLIVRVGPGLDDWLDNLLGSSHAQVVTAMQTTTLLPGEPDEDEHGGPHEHHATPGHLQDNPHVWLDPVKMRDDLAPAIAAALTRAAPQAAAGIAQRLAAYQQRLTKLDTEIHQKLDKLPSKRYIAGHRAWAYFDARYGLELVAVVEPVPGTDPSARWLKSVVDLAKSKHAQAVYAEVQLNQALSQTVARDAQLRFGVLDDQGGERIAGRDSYVTLMQFNAEQLATGLKP